MSFVKINLLESKSGGGGGIFVKIRRFRRR